MQNKINSRAGGKRIEIKIGYGWEIGGIGKWTASKGGGSECQTVQVRYHTADKKLAYISPRKLQVASRNYHRQSSPYL